MIFINRIFSIFSLSVFLISTNVLAETKNSSENSVDIEVIEIIGKFSKARLGKITIQAELDLYEKFNSYNDIFEFNVICRPKAKVGSHIKRHHCEPVYFKNEYVMRNQNMFLNPGIDFSRHPSDLEVWYAVKNKRKKSEKHMIALADKHPDLKLSLERYIKAVRAYELKEKMLN